MKKVLCLILVLVFCLSMACPVFAVDSPSCDCGGNCGSDCDCDPGCTCGCQDGSGVLSPKTGDIIMMWVGVMLVALIALVAAVVIFRKKFA